MIPHESVSGGLSPRVNDRVSGSFSLETTPKGARTGGSGGDEMRYRATVVADKWHGEFGSYDEWARLGPQPPYRTATFFDAQGRRCITQRDFARARDDRAFPVRYRWERVNPRKHT